MILVHKFNYQFPKKDARLHQSSYYLGITSNASLFNSREVIHVSNND